MRCTLAKQFYWPAHHVKHEEVRGSS